MIHPVLRQYWPQASQLLLLKVALADAATAKRAWDEWLAHNSLDDASWEEVRLLASAARRMRQLDPSSPLLRRLDGVRRFVWTRTQMNVNAACPLLAVLCEAGVRLMLLKGAARLALDPQTAADRSLGDIDVLVHPDDWPKALEIANRQGWREQSWPVLTTKAFPFHHALAIQDDGGHTIDLHHLASFICRNAGDDCGLWHRARPATLRGLSLFAPSPTDEVLLSIAHGLLYGGDAGPSADWIMDIAPLIRSGEVDWTVLESEACARNLETNIVSGLLLAVEHFDFPVPPTVLDRLVSRVREPFISDFRSFATCYFPSDPWTVERVKAAATLRALGAVRRLGKDPPPNALASPPASAAKMATPEAEFAELVTNGQPARFAAPASLDPEGLLALHISLHVEPHSGPARALLEVWAPGLILKRWRAPLAGSVNIVVQMPAALFAMRRIEQIELRAVESAVPVPFRSLKLTWEMDESRGTYSELMRFFDPVWYQRKCPATAASAVELLWDYLETGWLDGRNPGLRFDGNAYLRSNPDVAAAGINPLLHYVRRGAAEGRVARPVLPRKMADTRRSIGDPFAADLRVVAKSGCFDPAFYCSAYPEVLASDLDPIDEFVRGGWRAKRSPGPGFDAGWYLQKYPDVVAMDMNPLVHYARYGRKEGRSPCAAGAESKMPRNALMRRGGQIGDIFGAAWRLLVTRGGGDLNG